MIAAVILGGTSLFGDGGLILDTLLGSLTIGVIKPIGTCGMKPTLESWVWPR